MLVWLPTLSSSWSGLARKHGVDTDAVVRARLADIFIDEQLLDLMGRRMRAAAAAGLGDGSGRFARQGRDRPGRAGVGEEVAMLVGGPDVLAWERAGLDSEHWAHEFVYSPMTGIAGGTTEIQKNSDRRTPTWTAARGSTGPTGTTRLTRQRRRLPAAMVTGPHEVHVFIPDVVNEEHVELRATVRRLLRNADS